MHSLHITSNCSDRVKHSVIIIPALKTNSAIFDFITRNWHNKYGLSVHILNVWNTEKDFPSMLEKVVNKIDKLSNNGDTVSLIGASGGGNLAINAFIQRKRMVNKVINVCGRMRVGKHTDLDISPNDKQLKAYIKSIHFLESNIASLSSDDKMKIMTIRPRFGQEFVPVDTVTIDGGNNIAIPTFEHILSIVAALTIFKRLLISFIES
jgi:hypothetical protein